MSKCVFFFFFANLRCWIFDTSPGQRSVATFSSFSCCMMVSETSSRTWFRTERTFTWEHIWEVEYCDEREVMQVKEGRKKAAIPYTKKNPCFYMIFVEYGSCFPNVLHIFIRPTSFLSFTHFSQKND